MLATCRGKVNACRNAAYYQLLLHVRLASLFSPYCIESVKINRHFGKESVCNGLPFGLGEALGAARNFPVVFGNSFPENPV
jgi:hypothetical protein